MNKTKKSGLLKIAGLMAAVTMLTTCVVSGTMAKYTSEGKVTGIADVTPAKWSVTVGGTDIATEGTVSLSSLNWEIKQETNVNATPATGKIAPGTWGYAAIEIKNESEVDADITVSITNPSADSGSLHFTTVAMDHAPSAYSEATGALTDIKLNKKDSSSKTSITIYICYEWKYENEPETNDPKDTALGAAAEAISFSSANLTVTAEPNA